MMRDQAAHLDVDTSPIVPLERDSLGPVPASITAGSTPVHSATSIAGPNRSTALLVRTRASSIRSTTVTAIPAGCQ